jgi:hypothetical protein
VGGTTFAVHVVKAEAVLAGAAGEVGDPLLGLIQFLGGVVAVHVREQPDSRAHGVEPVVRCPPDSLSAIDVLVGQVTPKLRHRRRHRRPGGLRHFYGPFQEE